MANPKIDKVIADLTKEVAENTTVSDSAIAFIHGVPDLVKAAVDAARAEADLTPEQEAIFTELNTKLDANEQKMIAALTANTPPAPPTP